jgi:hypothetical protein
LFTVPEGAFVHLDLARDLGDWRDDSVAIFTAPSLNSGVTSCAVLALLIFRSGRASMGPVSGISHHRTSVGLDVHARSVVPCGLPGPPGIDYSAAINEDDLELAE